VWEIKPSWEITVTPIELIDYMDSLPTSSKSSDDHQIRISSFLSRIIPKEIFIDLIENLKYFNNDEIDKILSRGDKGDDDNYRTLWMKFLKKQSDKFVKRYVYEDDRIIQKIFAKEYEFNEEPYPSDVCITITRINKLFKQIPKMKDYWTGQIPALMNRHPHLKMDPNPTADNPKRLHLDLTLPKPLFEYSLDHQSSLSTETHLELMMRGVRIIDSANNDRGELVKRLSKQIIDAKPDILLFKHELSMLVAEKLLPAFVIDCVLKWPLCPKFDALFNVLKYSYSSYLFCLYREDKVFKTIVTFLPILGRKATFSQTLIKGDNVRVVSTLENYESIIDGFPADDGTFVLIVDPKNKPKDKNSRFELLVITPNTTNCVPVKFVNKLAPGVQDFNPNNYIGITKLKSSDWIILVPNLIDNFEFYPAQIIPSCENHFPQVRTNSTLNHPFAMNSFTCIHANTYQFNQHSMNIVIIAGFDICKISADEENNDNFKVVMKIIINLSDIDNYYQLPMLQMSRNEEIDVLAVDKKNKCVVNLQNGKKLNLEEKMDFETNYFTLLLALFKSVDIKFVGNLDRVQTEGGMHNYLVLTQSRSFSTPFSAYFLDQLPVAYRLWFPPRMANFFWKQFNDKIAQYNPSMRSNLPFHYTQ